MHALAPSASAARRIACGGGEPRPRVIVVIVAEESNMVPATAALLRWVGEYGYPFLGGLLLLAAAGAPIPVEAVLVALGALSASGGGLSFVVLMVIGIGATVAGDALDYAIGRLLGQTAIERWIRGMVPESRATGTADDATAWQMWLRRLVAWSGSGAMIVISRCVLTPLEMPISLLAGASRRSFRSFFVYDLVGEAVYVVGYLTLGHAGGTLASSGPWLPVAGVLAALLSVAPLLLVRWLAGCGAVPRWMSLGLSLPAPFTKAPANPLPW